MKIFHHIQSATGATKSEVVVVLGLVVVLLLGHALGRCTSGIVSPVDEPVSHVEVLRRLDSLLVASEPQADSTQGDADARRDRANASQHQRSPSSILRSSASRSRVNINTASITQLQTLPGVGQATAERIIEHRRQTPFRRPEDIMLIRGIGEKKFAKMQPFIAAP